MLHQTMIGGWRPWAARLAGCCLLFIFAFPCDAQNLVPNPSFEEYEECPYTIGFQPGNRPTYWRSWLNSPEYFHACAGSLQDIDTLVSVPQNGWGYQYAWDGDAYVGGYMYWVGDEFREYIGVQLLESLEVGETYSVSIRVSLAWGGSYDPTMGACNNIGVLFTTTSNAWTGLTGPPFPFRNDAHVYTPDIITDSLGWTLVSGMFTADSAYQHLVLGNFFNNALTDTLGIPPWNGEVAYYFIDDVCVSHQKGGCAMTGIEEVNYQQGAFAAFDTEALQVVIAWPGKETFLAEVIDMSGRVVTVGKADGGRFRAEAQGWSAGLYIARLRQGDRVEVVKFVIGK